VPLSTFIYFFLVLDKQVKDCQILSMDFRLVSLILLIHISGKIIMLMVCSAYQCLIIIKISKYFKHEGEMPLLSHGCQKRIFPSSMQFFGLSVFFFIRFSNTGLPLCDP